MPFLLRCAFSCVSSAPSTVCRSNYIACRQKVSHQCVGLQILGASVRVAALLACKGLFSSVCEHVAPQITSLSTTIITLVTSERLLS